MATAPTCVATDSRGTIRIEVVLTRFEWFVVPGDKILDDSHMREIHRPAAPGADTNERPPLLGREELAATTAE